ncbi:MAG TPA: tyrosine-protein phosphatase [Steroidobacteraceae bacterium]|nr:tyrosine-protein phosphatase [Steroidobacteraceae bacterium]
MMTPSPPTQVSRIVNLEGSCNFRDLGGYRTRDGRELKWGRVFRTGVLSYFTPNDHDRLNQLGVRAICDLRRADEREREPTSWPDANTQHLSWDDGDSPPTIRSIATNHPYTAAGMHGAMIDMYRALPAWMAPRLRGMFARIAQGDVPIIVHCAAGKDRTGIAIALLLAVLDVPQETIVEDYLLTNDAVDMEQFILTRHEAHLGIAISKHPLLTLPEDIRRVIFAAHVDYLSATFDQIACDHGDVTEFLHKEVGVDDTMRNKVRSALLSAG